MNMIRSKDSLDVSSKIKGYSSPGEAERYMLYKQNLNIGTVYHVETS